MLVLVMDDDVSIKSIEAKMAITNFLKFTISIYTCLVGTVLQFSLLIVDQI